MNTNTSSSDAGAAALPVYCKTRTDWSWPAERRFYLLTRNGPFFCRDTAFFKSSVPVQWWQPQLGRHQTSVELRYPLVPGRLLERVVGFFEQVASDCPAEAIVLLTYHPQDGYDVLIPEQQSLVEGYAFSRCLPVSVGYKVPTPPAGALLVGSIHSHPGPLGAFSSPQDAADAQHHFPGLHFVVGSLGSEPPALHCLFSVDGTSVEVAEPYGMVEGYRQRERSFPPEWLDRVTIEVVAPCSREGVQPKQPQAARGGKVKPSEQSEVPVEN